MPSPSPSSTTSTTNTAPWSGQQPYLTGNSTPGWAPDANTFNGGGVATTSGGPGLLPAAQALYTDTSAWPGYYPGQTYQGMVKPQTDLQGSLENLGYTMGNSSLGAANSALTDQLSSGTNATNGAFNASQGYLSNMIGGSTLNPFTSPGFQNVVNGTLASVIPATSASFINGGRSDSGLAQAAQTSAATNAIGTLANQNYVQEQGLQQGAAGLAGTNYTNQQGNLIKGAAMAPAIDQTQSADISTGLNAAGLTQQDLQNQTNANIAEWNYNQALPYNMLGMYQNYTGGNYGGASSTSTPYFSNTFGNIASGASGLASAAMMASMAFSDRNLKTDIKKIGVSDSGFPLYMFRYKGEPVMSRHIGVMAQDVEKRRPEAVFETPIGKAVNYTAALAK